MAIPATTAEYLDLTDAAFTANGSPTAALGQHSASNTTYDFDNVNDYLTSSETPASTASETTHSCSFWFKTTDTDDAIMVGQREPLTDATAAWNMYYTASGELHMYWFSGTSNHVNRKTTGTYNDGVWHHAACTLTSKVIKIYVDGVEASYASTTNETGTYSGTTASATGLSVGGASDYGKFGGSVDRIKYWEGTELSAAQVSEEYTAEFDAVVVPTPTFEDLDLSDGWTETGSPAYVDDQHNPGAALNADGSDDYLSKTGEVGTSETQFSMACWVKTTDTGAVILNQRTSSSVGQFTFKQKGSVDELEIYAFTDGSNYVYSQASNLGVGDDSWYHVCAIVDGTNNVAIYVNGVEVSYTIDTGEVGTFTSTGGVLASLEVANRPYAPALLAGIVSRIKIWDSTTLSEAQANKEYDNEFAAIGEGFSTDTTSPLISPLIDPAISSMFGSDLFLSS